MNATANMLGHSYGPRDKGKLIGQEYLAAEALGDLDESHSASDGREDSGRDLAPFNLAMDGKLRVWDPVSLYVQAVAHTAVIMPPRGRGSSSRRRGLRCAPR
jgi:hypothetical protein